MWFLRRPRKKPHKMIKKIVVGFIIGGAIASIIGKKLLDKHGVEDKDDEDTD